MFVEAKDLPFCDDVKRAINVIRGELQDGYAGRMMPWSQGGAYEGDWSVLPLLYPDDCDVPHLIAQARQNQQHFTKTIELLRGIRGLSLVAFSSLGPDTFVHRHVDADRPPVIRCHLGLMVPEGCTLELDHETRAHANGKWVNFHGAAPHSARNPSSIARVTLMVDVLRSEYPEALRRAAERAAKSTAESGA